MTAVQSRAGAHSTAFLAACMGGWCTHRDHCGAYHAMNRQEPAERLCARGEETPTPVRVVNIVRRAA